MYHQLIVLIVRIILPHAYSDTPYPFATQITISIYSMITRAEVRPTDVTRSNPPNLARVLEPLNFGFLVNW